MSAVTITLIIAASLLSGILVWLAQRYASVKKLAVSNERLQQQSQLIEQLQAEKQKLQSEAQQSIQQLAVAGGRLQMLEEQYELYQRQQKENLFLQNQLALFKAKFQSAEEKLSTQKQDMEQLGEQFRSEFKNLAQSILEEKTEKFTRINEDKMKAILDPFKNQLGEFKQ